VALQVLAERIDRLERDDAACVADALCHAERVPADVGADIEDRHAWLHRRLQQPRGRRFERVAIDERAAEPRAGVEGPGEACARDRAAGRGKDCHFVRRRCHCPAAIGRMAPLP